MMFQLTLAVALTAISLLGILLNSAILSSLMNKTQLQTIANIFFFNQALADILFLSLLPLIGTEYYLDRWPFGEVACRSLIILDSMNQFTSVFLLTVMSVDRYLSLSRPLTGVQFRTKQYAWILSGTAWILAALVCCPLWFSSQSFEGNEDSVLHCYFLESEDSDSAYYYKLFTIWAFAIGFCLPLAIISSTNYSILDHIRKGHAVNNDTQSRVHINNRPSRDERRKKTCVIVVACTIIFSICWLPLYIFLIHVYFFANNPTSPQLESAAFHQNFTNSTFLLEISSEFNTSFATFTKNEIFMKNESLLMNSSLSKIDINELADSEDESLNHIRMFCLLLSYCNGMFNPIVLLIMSGHIRKNLCTCFSFSRRGQAFDPTHLYSRSHTRNRRKSSHIPTAVRRQAGPPVDTAPEKKGNELTTRKNGSSGHNACALQLSTSRRSYSRASHPSCHQNMNDIRVNVECV